MGTIFLVGLDLTLDTDLRTNFDLITKRKKHYSIFNNSSDIISVPVLAIVAAHNFDVKIDNGEYTLEFDTAEHYGCFEHNLIGDESGGGLWFDEHGVLLDYDGVYELPASVVLTLRTMGFTVED